MDAPECKRCHKTMIFEDGLDPTEYCHQCYIELCDEKDKGLVKAMGLFEYLIAAIDSGQCEMSSAQIKDSYNNIIPPHPWHDEWLYYVRKLIAKGPTDVNPENRKTGGQKMKESVKRIEEYFQDIKDNNRRLHWECSCKNYDRPTKKVKFCAHCGKEAKEYDGTPRISMDGFRTGIRAYDFLDWIEYKIKKGGEE